MLNILIVLKTILYINITNISNNRILILLITSLITISWLSLIDKFAKKRAGKIKAVAYSILSLIIFADSLYYIQFNTLPSVKLLGQIGLLTSVTDAIYTILSLKNLLLILDIPLVCLYYFRKQEGERALEVKYPLVGLGLVLGFTLATGRFSGVKTQELYSYHLGDIIGAFSPSKTLVSQEDIEDLRERARLKEGNLTGLAQGKNLIVIQVEALQNFVVGLDYKGQEITPNINKLIGEKGSLYYDNYYQLVGRGNTSDAEFVSNNSLHPAMDQPSYTRYEKNTFYGLPKLLKDNNYRTMAMHGYKKEFWNRENAYKYQGFDEFLDQDFYSGQDIIGMGVSDEEFFRENVAYLKKFKEENDQPFYAFMVTLTSHTPFKMEEKYQKIKMEEKYNKSMVKDYIQSIHYLDEQIGYFMELLKESGLYDDTIVAIYGDHFAIKVSDEKKRDLMTDLLGYRYDYDTMMNIPLIIHLANEDINQTISKVGSQIDFYPTIQNLLGYDNEKGLIFGRDLNNYKGENTVKPQTYMEKGSFIKSDLVFEIARDGIFDHSRAYDKKTRQPVEITKLRTYYEEAIREINISDYLAINDLLKEYMETGRIDLAGERFGLKKYKRVGSLEEAKKYGGLGSLLVEVDKSEDLGEIIDYSDEKGLDLILSGSPDQLLEAYGKYQPKNQLARIEDIGDYVVLTNEKYEKIILNPYEKNYKEEDLEEFISMYPSLALELKEKDLKKYKKKNVTIYLEKN